MSTERRIPFTIQSWYGYKRMSSVRNMMCFSTRMAGLLPTRCFFITHGGIVDDYLLKKIRLDKRILYLLEKQEDFLK